MKIKQTKYDLRFSALIRLRDSICQRCLKGGRLECSHIYSRRHKALRHDTRNAKALCFRCHRWWHENPAEAADWLISIIGADNAAKLQLMANTATKAPKKPELDVLYKEMKAEIDYLNEIPEGKRQHLQFRNRYKKAKESEPAAVIDIETVENIVYDKGKLK